MTSVYPAKRVVNIMKQWRRQTSRISILLKRQHRTTLLWTILDRNSVLKQRQVFLFNRSPLWTWWTQPGSVILVFSLRLLFGGWKCFDYGKDQWTILKLARLLLLNIYVRLYTNHCFLLKKIILFEIHYEIITWNEIKKHITFNIDSFRDFL